eukprot:CAMPEP_0183295660 /NCGR_PEP_ID=MMETSP0160_2-20130417/3534_1 /TAXON_ID=2839 ORGANISM="Odontella Sinensis, Strain Grunow 1884" /NCGR_SAMPLE_ID=MMETSP0160_2 /ASSEMBLY_ACC=CAM_ASM_000250 /LENGTH=204 /DNA_ID=CAMNT_0025457179 /DNA_START=34 /DNA_END=648 /DNA_ORIENTATION=-
MKLAIVALLAGSAAAFAPAQTGRSSVSLNAFKDEVGAQAPLGFFDPLGMLDGADQERFDRLRFVERKHGRIAMLAFLGQITTRAGFHLPGDIDYAGHSFASYPNGLAALFGDNAIPTLGLWQIIFFIGFLELGVMSDITGTGDFPGDFRNGVVHGNMGWDKYTDDQKRWKEAIELNNGRAAQMGILGLMVHEQLGSNMPIIGQL